jgi:hypothetical protein
MLKDLTTGRKGMMQRRLLLKLTGCAVMAGALGAGAARFATEAQDTLRPPGTYEISGRVRLQESSVEISGISNAQQISWSAGSLPSPVATFSSFERFDRPWRMPDVRVRGGQLEALTVRGLDFI